MFWLKRLSKICRTASSEHAVKVVFLSLKMKPAACDGCAHGTCTSASIIALRFVSCLSLKEFGISTERCWPADCPSTINRPPLVNQSTEQRPVRIISRERPLIESPFFRIVFAYRSVPVTPKRNGENPSRKKSISKAFQVLLVGN